MLTADKPTPGLVLVVGRMDGKVMVDAFGGYIPRSQPIEVTEGVSWRDALAEESARANALEDLLASIGVEVEYHFDAAAVAARGEVQTLTVNDQPWELGR